MQRAGPIPFARTVNPAEDSFKMKFSFAFVFVLLAVFSMIGSISAGVCEGKQTKATAKACSLRCGAKNFDEGKCVKDQCVCSKPRS
uniref:Invertebrate defensins family profile domain-containing protein n=1 Tax=Anopheles dirus TaxID=7168 RepID=A0A182NMK9_9DIPT